jgi:hypothetical protein
MAELRGRETGDALDYRHLQNDLFKAALSRGTTFLIPIMPRPFPRAVAQQSVLTVSPKIASALPSAQVVRHQLSTRVLIREGWKKDILAACRSMGISRLSLFRDYDSLREDITGLFMAKRDIPFDPW